MRCVARAGVRVLGLLVHESGGGPARCRRSDNALSPSWARKELPCIVREEVCVTVVLFFFYRRTCIIRMRTSNK